MTLGYGLGSFPKTQVASIRVVGHIEGGTQVMLFDAADDHDPLLRAAPPAPPDIALTSSSFPRNPLYTRAGETGCEYRRRDGTPKATLPLSLGASSSLQGIRDSPRHPTSRPSKPPLTPFKPRRCPTRPLLLFVFALLLHQWPSATPPEGILG